MEQKDCTIENVVIEKEKEEIKTGLVEDGILFYYFIIAFQS